VSVVAVVTDLGL